jgi:hypothetical protein
MCGIALLAVGCKKKETPLAPTPEVESAPVYSLSVTELALELGDSQVITVNGLRDTDTVIYESNDSAIVSIEQTGKITAMGVGSTFITAMIGDEIFSCDVTVNIKYEYVPKIYLRNEPEAAIGEYRLNLIKGEQYTIEPLLQYNGVEIETDFRIEYTGENIIISGMSLLAQEICENQKLLVKCEYEGTTYEMKLIVSVGQV